VTGRHVLLAVSALVAGASYLAGQAAPLDVVFVNATVPDTHGFVSLGTSV